VSTADTHLNLRPPGLTVNGRNHDLVNYKYFEEAFAKAASDLVKVVVLVVDLEFALAQVGDVRRSQTDVDIFACMNKSASIMGR
jgi:hypothetical protein